MKRKTHHPDGNEAPFIKPPAYPFTGGILWQDLHAAMSAELGIELSRPFLARLIGKATSNVYAWLNALGPKQLLAFMCLLEWLSPPTREKFIQAHCRVCPTLDHRRFFYPKGMRERTRELLTKASGLTLIVGSNPSFLLNGLGHSWVIRSAAPATGLDLHRPTQLVPATGVSHLDETLDCRELRRLILQAWPRLLVSPSGIVLLNGVWSRLPEWRPEILRLATHKHVVLADGEETQIAGLSANLNLPIDLVTLSPSQRKKEGLRVICQRRKIFTKRP